MAQQKPIMLTARVDEHDLSALERIARSYGLSRSEALRRCVWTVAKARNLAPAPSNGGQEVLEHEPS